MQKENKVIGINHEKNNIKYNLKSLLQCVRGKEN